MPNWCRNFTAITHADASVIAKLAEGFNSNRLFESLIPPPLHLRDENGIDPLDALSSKLKSDPNETIDDWRANNWGSCESGVGPYGEFSFVQGISDDRKSLYLRFDTPWKPPFRAFDAWVELECNVECYFHEEGMQIFGVYNNGTVVHFSDPETLASEVKDEISEDLCEKLFVDEYINEYLDSLEDPEEEEDEDEDEGDETGVEDD